MGTLLVHRSVAQSIQHVWVEKWVTRDSSVIETQLKIVETERELIGSRDGRALT